MRVILEQVWSTCWENFRWLIMVKENNIYQLISYEIQKYARTDKVI